MLWRMLDAISEDDPFYWQIEALADDLTVDLMIEDGVQSLTFPHIDRALQPVELRITE
jgi:hypothetical protein